MTSPGRQLFDSILTNSLGEVRILLDKGADPNVSLTMISSYTQFKISQRPESIDKVLLWKRDFGLAPRPLHIAVINCYHHFSHEGGVAKALGILKAILEHGGDTSMKSNNIFLWDVDGKERSVVQKSQTPLDLALALKRALSAQQPEEHAEVMDIIMGVLREHEEETRYMTLPVVKVSESLLEMMQSLLFSRTLSDISFICSDGTNLPAHKCVLAAASEYFRAAFTGSWAENNPAAGEWRTDNSSAVMKSVLAFIYTGKGEEALLYSDPIALLPIAFEYCISSLMAMVESSCSRQLTRSNMKQTLQSAHFYGSSRLKKACFDFVRNQGASMIAERDFLILASEDPHLWKELMAVVSSNPSARKRSQGTSPVYGDRECTLSTPNKKSRTSVLFDSIHPLS